MSVVIEKLPAIERNAPQPLWARLVGAWRRIGEMAQRQRQRRHLARLDDHLLDDIGLSREQVNSELAKPFWR